MNLEAGSYSADEGYDHLKLDDEVELTAIFGNDWHAETVCRTGDSLSFLAFHLHVKEPDILGNRC